MNDENIGLLESEIQSVLESLKDMDASSEEYKSTVEVLTKLVDRSIKEKELRQDAEIKERQMINDCAIKRDQLINDSQLKREQLRKENIRGWVSNGIAIAGLIIPTAVTIWGTKRSFEFEKEGSITTIMGRGFIQKLLPRNKN